MRKRSRASHELLKSFSRVKYKFMVVRNSKNFPSNKDFDGKFLEFLLLDLKFITILLELRAFTFVSLDILDRANNFITKV